MTDPQTFRLLDPTGKEIMTGSMSAIMERLPNTTARDAALESMLRTAADAVEAEQKRDDAVRSAANAVCDTLTHLTARMDAYIARREAQRKADEEQAARQEQEEIQHYLDQLPDPDEEPNLNTGDLSAIVTAPEDPEATVLEPDDTGPNELVEMRPVTDPAELAHAPKAPTQPIAISLNEE
jgi:hypothetical protein